MTKLADRQFLGYCVLSATLGFLAAIWIFPNRGVMMYLLPVVILAVLMFADGYFSSP
ncbi:hypothetical protein [Halovenus salina]|uniref:hypothetical protein n=1 Tax=Halovenus salina TaxID=1510225 RepID=UPI002260E655|nr:hypothetical protein [Halovenus salina]